MIQSITTPRRMHYPWELVPLSGFKKFFAYLIGLLAGLIAIIAGMMAILIFPIMAYTGDLPLNTTCDSLLFIGQELLCVILVLVGGKIVIVLNRRTEYDDFYCQGDVVAVIAGALYRRFLGRANIRYADHTIYITALLGPEFSGNLWKLIPILIGFFLTSGRILYYKLDVGVPQEIPVEADNIEWVKGNGPRLTIKLFHAPVPGLDRMTLFLPVNVAVSFLQDFQKHLPRQLPESYQQALANIRGAAE